MGGGFDGSEGAIVNEPGASDLFCRLVAFIRGGSADHTIAVQGSDVITSGSPRKVSTGFQAFLFLVQRTFEERTFCACCSEDHDRVETSEDDS